jgi:transglutaminase/protease-like cytokinesis protein 3
MFGSALPVCAVRFPTITELVHHGQNGMIFDNASELTEQILHLLFPHVLIDIREKRLSTSNSSSSSSSGSGSGSSSNSIINETTDSIEEDLPIPSDTIESSEITSEDTKEKRITAHPVTIEHNNYNQITLAALKGGAAEIGSWDDNWKAVLSPLVQSWIR